MIVVIDYGVGNVRSVTNALKFIGADVTVSCEPGDIEKADGIILPGVGACGYAMTALGTLAEVICEQAHNGKPLLGICLGYQILFEQSLEHGIRRSAAADRDKADERDDEDADWGCSARHSVERMPQNPRTCRRSFGSRCDDECLIRRPAGPLL